MVKKWEEKEPEPWPKEMAVRRLKEALEQIPHLEGLNHRDPTFVKWHENLVRILQHNWPDERLPSFAESRIRLRGEPSVTGGDINAYRRGLTTTRSRIEIILRNERELAEARNDTRLLEVFLPPGTQHDAYAVIRQIVSQANQELVIVDNYADATLFDLLTNAKENVAIKVLTFSTPADFALEGRKFLQQHRRTLEVRRDRNDFHDRFIMLDGKRVFHLGHSIKDAGNKVMMLHELRDDRNIVAAFQTFHTAWAGAAPTPL